MKELSRIERTTLVDVAVKYWAWLRAMYEETAPTRVLDEGWGYLQGLCVLVDAKTEEELGKAWSEFKNEYEGRA